MSVYLGLDASTQSLTASLIEVVGARHVPIAERSVVYEQASPDFGTTHGVLHGDDPAVVECPPLLWVETLDRLMAILVEHWPAEMARLTAIGGSAQQHGSVYLNAFGVSRLAHLDAAVPLATQFAGAFSRDRSPVWMDSSTTAECADIERAVGGAEVLAHRTGARAFERFTGPQIRGFAHRQQAAYQQTRRIHLISSFMASLLSGTDAPVDPAEASGTNLMDLETRSWWPQALAATAPDLLTRLPRIRPSSTIVGPLAGYWRTRYGLPAARVVAWTGDNPSSLIGSGAVHEGDFAISLGTSDTVCALLPATTRAPAGEGYVAASPTGGGLGTTVFKNGSLARERVRDAYGLDWAAFSAALASRPAGNHGAILLPWFDPEITPRVATPGPRRIGLDATDVAANVRGIVEAQMMAMANHTQWMGGHPRLIHASGGAAGNRAVLQVMADVFKATVVRARTRHAAALGAGLRAYHADRLATGTELPWAAVVAGFTDPDADWRIHPDLATAGVYEDLRRRYAEAEARALDGR